MNLVTLAGFFIGVCLRFSHALRYEKLLSVTAPHNLL